MQFSTLKVTIQCILLTALCCSQFGFKPSLSTLSTVQHGYSTEFCGKEVTSQFGLNTALNVSQYNRHRNVRSTYANVILVQ